MACFLWRLLRVLDIEVIAYVDELKLIAPEPEILRAVIACLFQIAQGFLLNISSTKSYLWGSYKIILEMIGMEWGLPVRTTLESMGMEWRLEPRATPAYARETTRI